MDSAAEGDVAEEDVVLGESSSMVHAKKSSDACSSSSSDAEDTRSTKRGREDSDSEQQRPPVLFKRPCTFAWENAMNFDSERHAYTWKGANEEDKEVTRSVSKVVSIAKMTLTPMQTYTKRSSDGTCVTVNSDVEASGAAVFDKFEFVNQSASAMAKERKFEEWERRRAFGTQQHAALEEWIKSEYPQKDVQKMWDDSDQTGSAPFWANHCLAGKGMHPISAETMLVLSKDGEHPILAGTVDVICQDAQDPNLFHILDWKCAKRMAPDDYMSHAVKHDNESPNKSNPHNLNARFFKDVKERYIWRGRIVQRTPPANKLNGYFIQLNLYAEMFKRLMKQHYDLEVRVECIVINFEQPLDIDDLGIRGPPVEFHVPDWSVAINRILDHIPSDGSLTPEEVVMRERQAEIDNKEKKHLSDLEKERAEFKRRHGDDDF